MEEARDVKHFCCLKKKKIKEGFEELYLKF
jgi:hypothetical protein